MTCTNCGKEVAGASGKCPDCGAALKENQPPTDMVKPEESQVCCACGAPLRENVRFCTKCGTRVQINSQDNVQHDKKETRNIDEKKRGGRLGQCH